MTMTSRRALTSTYRLQMRGPESGQAFTFADALDQLDYLDELGISHLYLSPILTASTGSTHGYDVTDPTTVSAELGGSEGLARLSEAVHARGMGLIVDIVPNHVGVEDPTQNAWWWDVLEHGRDSSFASYFDIDWELDPEHRVVLPVLGDDGDVTDLTVDGNLLRLGDRTWPIAAGTGDGSGPEVHDRQNYKLIGWKNNLCGYRRFFSITSLAGLRQEDRTVFDATHVEVKRWFTEGLVDGLRIDHPDGLSDPAGYLEWLRELTGPDAWIVIEKILAPDEALEPTLPVAGTTGYDALRDIGGLLVDPSGAPTGPDHSADEVGRLKIASATVTLASELSRLHRAIVASVGVDHPQIPDAVAALLSHIGVYRSDYRGLSAVMSTALAHTASDAPELAEPLALVAAALDDVEPATRLQQLCGAVTAKSVEDCLFYRDARLVSLNEVGGELDRFGVSAAEFHHSSAGRARSWPSAMVTLSTHDTKRSEDVRAPNRRPVPGFGAVDAADRDVGRDLPAAGYRDGILPPAERVRSVARRWERDGGAAVPIARLRREGDQGSVGAHHLERSRRGLRGSRSPLARRRRHRLVAGMLLQSSEEDNGRMYPLLRGERERHVSYRESPPNAA